MNTPDTDKVFTGSIPKLYESHLVPLIFEPYAADIVKMQPTNRRKHQLLNMRSIERCCKSSYLKLKVNRNT